MILLALVLACSVPLKIPGTTDEYIDMIELNHFYDTKGNPVFDQVIFWEKWPSNGKYHIRAWCLADENSDPLENRRPKYNHEIEMWIVLWNDNDAKLKRKLKTRIYRESWTQVDPERVDKKYLDERYRIGLVQRPEKFKVPEPVYQEPVPEPTGP